LDPDEVLVGIVPIARLLALPPETAVGQAMEAGYPRVPPDRDQDRVAARGLYLSRARMGRLVGGEVRTGLVIVGPETA
jgi:Mg/Co/Ni transporter MgtE